LIKGSEKVVTMQGIALPCLDCLERFLYTKVLIKETLAEKMCVLAFESFQNKHQIFWKCYVPNA
jgi:hypothetical protein